ncbi:predicted protein [Plenodomus lingam JN3]|uniref:Predicted protein n=1 Tax=Leptosphaeria maculans (strain JN3 / isolate v23.1.3 / race Av1-4-5-6-7-8) TaxID=985895 RepID=E5A8Y5_LEPMJ|nr:predicted protein [Plenodomus lingam JN3]CBY00080.1 predicted protein [Plenodomus lingam JN3]
MDCRLFSLAHQRYDLYIPPLSASSLDIPHSAPSPRTAVRCPRPREGTRLPQQPLPSLLSPPPKTLVLDHCPFSLSLAEENDVANPPPAYDTSGRLPDNVTAKHMHCLPVRRSGRMIQSLPVSLVPLARFRRTLWVTP